MTPGSQALASDKTKLSIHDRLGLISLIDEGLQLDNPETPVAADLFSDLWDMVNKTVRGAKIEPFKPGESRNVFRVLEINAETGENLGRLNMLYFNKPIPCYYLVYVEVAAPFRRKGLGNKIIKHFSDFLSEKSALGLLDNIIPKDDPTFDIYAKQNWRSIREIIGGDNHDGYMVYVPKAMQARYSDAGEKSLRGPLLKLLHHLKRRRPAIEMKDNEAMVRQTISEFMDLYKALMTYFKDDLDAGRRTPVMRFMFTRFVTKLIAFRRRITELIGYTGGESLQQVNLAPEVMALPIQSYPPRDLVARTDPGPGDETLWLQLPEDLKKTPAQAIEALPNYQRPSLTAWYREKGRSPDQELTIGDLMDMGFDPTRLKELSLDGEDYIIERIQARQTPDIERKREILSRLAGEMKGYRAKGASVLVNPPLLTIPGRGNAYVLRRKVPGIHWEEAIEQLQSTPPLKALNDQMKIDRVISGTVRMATREAAKRTNLTEKDAGDILAFFISWDLETNRPRVIADFTSTFMESIWLA